MPFRTNLCRHVVSATATVALYVFTAALELASGCVTSPSTRAQGRTAGPDQILSCDTTAYVNYTIASRDRKGQCWRRRYYRNIFADVRAESETEETANFQQNCEDQACIYS